MSKIIFVTSNDRKIAEAQRSLDLVNLDLETVTIELDEIQSLDTNYILEQKARLAFQKIGQPLLVQDDSWSIPAYNGFPGGYMKDLQVWFSPQDFVDIISLRKDRTIICISKVAFIDESELVTFTKDYHGIIADLPRGNSGSSVMKVAQFQGKTIAEFADNNEFAISEEESVWHDVAIWLSQHFPSR